MTDTTQEELPPLPVGAGFYLDEYSQEQMQDYARQCIATLKAENEKLRAELATHQESSFHPDWSMLEATRSSLREHMAAWQAAQSQAAAMAGLLEEARNLAVKTMNLTAKKDWDALTDRIDAALAAWKGKQ
jgi:cell division septum initiation protein DivIVA